MPLRPDSLLPFDASRETVPILLVSADDMAGALPDITPAQTAWAKNTGFAGKSGQTALIPAEDGALAAVLVGTGDTALAPSDLWAIAAPAASLPEGVYRIAAPKLDCPVFESLALGWVMGQYRFDRYKEVKEALPTLMLGEGYILEPVLVKARAMALIRDLINTPAEDMGPADLEEAVAALAEANGATFSSIVGDDLLEEGFPSIHAVGRAATEARAPRLLDLSWSAEGAADDAPLITLVGKGVCFDSGGLNIKPAGGMRLMKKDMGGAAHAIALAQLIIESGLKVRLRLLVSAVENAISGGAFRPGDVLDTRKGLTVEVGNTDAEGRLVLSDALALACEESPDLLMDFATLTGAARVALGADLPATYTNSDEIWAALDRASTETADPLWRMPLHGPYDDLLASSVADVSHISEGPLAGSITAALFLQRFVEPDVPWVHFDLFGWMPSAKPGRSVGGTAQTLMASFSAIRSHFDL